VEVIFGLVGFIGQQLNFIFLYGAEIGPLYFFKFDRKMKLEESTKIICSILFNERIIMAITREDDFVS
jgi:hypothetical protein